MLKQFLLSLFVIAALAAEAQNYKRIVSLAPSLTQSLYFLEAQDLLVGCTYYCEAAKKDNKPVVASAVKINIEKLLSVKPDLVIASGLSDVDDLQTIRKFGIKVEVFRSPKSFDDICAQFSDLGKAIGKEAEAGKIVSESKRKIGDIVSRRKSKPRVRIFFQIGANPLFAVIPDTYLDDYISFLNGENIASGLKHGTVGREFVIAKNPDYIFVATMGLLGDEEKEAWLKYPNLAAAKKKQVFVVDSETACQPTPVTFVQTMEALDKHIEQ